MLESVTSSHSIIKRSRSVAPCTSDYTILCYHNSIQESQHGESKPVTGQGLDPPPFTGADFLLLCCLQVCLLCITG
jgi:hypothetical protein